MRESYNYVHGVEVASLHGAIVEECSICRCKPACGYMYMYLSMLHALFLPCVHVHIHYKPHYTQQGDSTVGLAKSRQFGVL